MAFRSLLPLAVSAFLCMPTSAVAQSSRAAPLREGSLFPPPAFIEAKLKGRARGGVAQVDAGSNAGVEPGHRVCWFAKARIMGCSVIEETLPDAARFYVRRGDARYVLDGMRARVYTGQKRTRSRLSLGYVYTPALPFAFRSVGYDATSVADATAAPWQRGEPVSSSSVGLKLQVSAAALTSSAVAAAVVWRGLDVPNKKLDLQPGVTDPYAEAETRADSLGVPIVFRTAFGDGGMRLVLAEGLQVDLSQVRYRLTQIGPGDSRGPTLARAVSTVSSLAIRLEAGVQFLADSSASVHLDLGAAVPVAVFGRAQSASAKLPTALPTRAESAAEELLEALGVREAKVSADVTLALSLRL